MERRNKNIASFQFDIDLEDNKLNNNQKIYDVYDVDSRGLKDQEHQKRLRYTQDTKERKLLSHWVMCVVSLWLLGVLTVISFNKVWNLCISPTVCSVLLGTTTANILGLAFIVLKGLFPNGKNVD
jgi:hypothetical protein